MLRLRVKTDGHTAEDINIQADLLTMSMEWFRNESEG